MARTKKNLEAAAAELRGKTRVEIFAMDVSDPDACVDMFKKADFEFGRIDILINNAGYHQRGPFASVDAADLGRMIDVNLKAPIMLTRIALPYMRDAGGGATGFVGVVRSEVLAGQAISACDRGCEFGRDGTHRSRSRDRVVRLGIAGGAGGLSV